MTHESILELIASVDSGVAADLIFNQPLTEGIDFARVWDAEPRGQSANEDSSMFYFIHNRSKECVGAVLDLGGDIHAVTAPAHRRKGLMAAAMHDVILPHMFSDGRTVLRAQICSPEGAALMTKLGFRILPNGWGELSKAAVPRWRRKVVRLPPLSSDQVARVHARIYAASACLREATVLLRGRAKAAVIDELEAAAAWIGALVRGTPTFDSDAADTPEPSLAPLEVPEQERVEGLVYRSAAWLRMIGDETDHRDNLELPKEARRLARRVISTGQNIRDDWHDRQFR